MYCVSYPLHQTEIPSAIASTAERGEGTGCTRVPVPVHAERPGLAEDPEEREKRAKAETPEKPAGSDSPGPVQVTHEPSVHMRTAALTTDELESRVKKLEVAVLFLALASAVSTLLLIRLALRDGSNRRTKSR